MNDGVKKKNKNLKSLICSSISEKLENNEAVHINSQLGIGHRYSKI